jgi:hypothetical protein
MRTFQHLDVSSHAMKPSVLQLVCSVLEECLSSLEGVGLTCADSQVSWAVIVPAVAQYQTHSGLTSAQQAARVFGVLMSPPLIEKYV